jgi:hypothetical protein
MNTRLLCFSHCSLCSPKPTKNCPGPCSRRPQPWTQSTTFITVYFRLESQATGESILRRWGSPVKIGLAAPRYSEFQNCTKYSAIKRAEVPKRSRAVDLKVDRWQLIQCSGKLLREFLKWEVCKNVEESKPELPKQSWTIDLKISREPLILAAAEVPKCPKCQSAEVPEVSLSH